MHNLSGPFQLSSCALRGSRLRLTAGARIASGNLEAGVNEKYEISLYNLRLLYIIRVPGSLNICFLSI